LRHRGAERQTQNCNRQQVSGIAKEIQVHNGFIWRNPNVGYGFQTMKYADGKPRGFYQIVMSGITTGISALSLV
jgi:hypothetical protein